MIEIVLHAVLLLLAGYGTYAWGRDFGTRRHLRRLQRDIEILATRPELELTALQLMQWNMTDLAAENRRLRDENDRLRTERPYR